MLNEGVKFYILTKFQSYSTCLLSSFKINFYRTLYIIVDKPFTVDGGFFDNGKKLITKIEITDPQYAHTTAKKK
jgi:hypothetical protein